MLGYVSAGTATRLAPMDLEEDSLPDLGDRCQVCGTKLTPREIEATMESGGPALCTIHADELVRLGDDEDPFDDE